MTLSYSPTAFQLIMTGKYVANMEDECLNLFMWLTDKAIHHDAFMQQTAHLKDLKYKVHRQKMNHAHNKLHYSSASKVNNNKMR